MTDLSLFSFLIYFPKYYEIPQWILDHNDHNFKLFNSFKDNSVARIKCKNCGIFGYAAKTNNIDLIFYRQFSRNCDMILSCNEIIIKNIIE